MSTKDREARILQAIQKFKEDAKEYTSVESQIDHNFTASQSKKEELSKVAQEERVKEIAEEVLFPGEQKGPSQARKLEEEVRALEAETNLLQDKLDKIQTQLTQSMYNLPIPVDLDKCRQEEGKTIFPFFDDMKLDEVVIKVMRKLLKIEKLEFQGVRILSDKVTVESASMNEGTMKLASGIKAYRLKLAEILKVYEQIDAMVERAAKSDLYPRVLATLLIEKKMSTADIARKIGENERKVYDACYNLTRDRWTPSPLEYASSGEWALTVSGEILANRLVEKHPERVQLETPRTASTSQIEEKF